MPGARRPQTAATDALIAVAPQLTRWIERLLAGHDPPLTLTQYLALRAVSQGIESGSEIARRAGVSGPAVSQLLAALTDAGLIDRATVASDRRRYRLALSAAGTAVLRSAEALLRRRLSAMLAGVPPHEVEALAGLLGAVEASLEGRHPPRRPPRPRRPPPPRPPGAWRGPTSPPGRRH
jgi:DNA-binding MarR family transcriptional regulator